MQNKHFDTFSFLQYSKQVYKSSGLQSTVDFVELSKNTQTKVKILKCYSPLHVNMPVLCYTVPHTAVNRCSNGWIGGWCNQYTAGVYLLSVIGQLHWNNVSRMLFIFLKCWYININTLVFINMVLYLPYVQVIECYWTN